MRNNSEALPFESPKQLPATAVVGSKLPQPLAYVQLPPMSQ
jgi:hypothetical protein